MIHERTEEPPMSSPNVSERSSAALIARFLRARGVDRVFALCGGHIMPIWMRLDAEGIRIIDVRDERAAVYMAHAHAELTGGIGVALVTAGPGVTNAMTGIANAHVARASVLVLSGTPPRAQENRGAIAAERPPHVPVLVQVGGVAPIAAADRRIDREVAHVESALPHRSAPLQDSPRNERGAGRW